MSDTPPRGGRATVAAGLPSPAALSYGLRVSVVSGPARGLKIAIGAAVVHVGSDAANEVVIADEKVSRRHLELASHSGGVKLRDLGSTNGTFLGGVRVTEAVVPPGTLIVVGDSELLIAPEADVPELPLSSRERLGGLIGRSPTMRQLFTAVERVAPTDYTVLVEGETGTGKEVVARALHELSPRREGPLVVFDCAATTESLLESELFGHVRGAFTGAVAPREGAFRRAHKGTLFIDELNSLPLGLQGKLLRVLETRLVHPVGADHELPVDLRVVAATNKRLESEVAAKRFREDLLYRMSVVRLSLPPLRARPEDIPMLVAHFLAGAGRADDDVTGPNLDCLVGYAWPGNVRELRNVIERALALAGSPHVPFAELPVAVGDDARTMSWPVALDLPYKEAKDVLVGAFERVYALQLLEKSGKNISEAARRAGLSRRHFFEMLKKHKLLPSDLEEPDDQG